MLTAQMPSSVTWTRCFLGEQLFAAMDQNNIKKKVLNLKNLIARTPCKKLVENLGTGGLALACGQNCHQ